MLDNQLNWGIEEEQNNDLLKESARKDYETNHLFQKTFGTASGKKVLEWLVTYTLDAPTWWPGRPADYGYFREGQNQLVRQIVKKIKDAENYKEEK